MAELMIYFVLGVITGGVFGIVCGIAVVYVVDSLTKKDE